MKKKIIHSVSVLAGLTVLFIIPFPANAETPLEDPKIPDSETAVYRIIEGVKEGRFTESVRVIAFEGEEIYSMSYRSTDETTETRLRREDMLPFSVDTVRESETSTVSTSTRVSLHDDVRTQKIMTLSLSDLKYALRGYPFGQEESEYEVAFLTGEKSGSSSDFTITVRSAGTEEISINEIPIACYRLELKVKVTGIMRIMNSFIGKTWFWYSVERPHYLVAYESTSGFRGSPKTHIEIVDYSGWKSTR